MQQFRPESSKTITKILNFSDHASVILQLKIVKVTIKLPSRSIQGLVETDSSKTETAKLFREQTGIFPDLSFETGKVRDED